MTVFGKKSIVMLGIMAAALFLGFSYSNLVPKKSVAVEVSFNHEIYENADELSKQAELIVIGHPTKDFDEETPTVYDNSAGRYESFFTPTSFKVQKVLKGEYDEKFITVLQTAANADSLDGNGKVFLCPDDYTVMEKNKKYILFLAKDDENEGYWIKALNQGKFNIDNTDIREQKLSKENELFGQLKKDVLKKYKDEF